MTQIAAFDSIERVVADDLRFRLRLGIGEDAYRAIRYGKALQRLWDVGGVAATGAAAAKSSVVAATFFGGSGLLGLIGLGTATTPLGWVIAAGVASAGAYWGVLRLVGSYGQSRVQKIPEFLNSPVDWLGATLVDMIGTVAMKLAAVQGAADAPATALVATHFSRDWGIDPHYAQRALAVIAAQEQQMSLEAAAHGLGQFLRQNEDCNAEAIRADVLSLLEAVIRREGLTRPEAEAALASVAQILDGETAPFLRRTARRLGQGVAEGATTVAKGALGAGTAVRARLGALVPRRKSPGPKKP